MIVSTSTVTLADLLIPLIPWLVVLAIMGALFVPTFRQIRRARDHFERMRQHMLAVEEKLDRLIEQGERRSRGE